MVAPSGRVSRHFDSFTTADGIESLAGSTNRQLVDLSITGSIVRASGVACKQVFVLTVTGWTESCSGWVVMQVVSLTKGVGISVFSGCNVTHLVVVLITGVSWTADGVT